MVNLSLDYVYSTQGQCEEDCVAWKCYDNLGITQSTKLYVLYDTSSMSPVQARNAYWGIQDFLQQQQLTGIQQQHTHIHNERWLGWHMIPYGIRNIDGTTSVMNGYIQSNVLWGQYVEEGFMKWAYGINVNGPYPNPAHFGSPRNNPASPPTSNTSGIGQPTTAFMTNTNPLNPNYALNAQVHPQFWVQTADTTDDVVMIIFCDEAQPVYHNNVPGGSTSRSLTNPPTNAYVQDYNHFLDLYDAVNQPCTGTSIYSATTLINPPTSTGTTSGGSGSFRAFVYPTSPGATTSKMQIFDLNVLGAISVGNLLDVDTNTPFNGVWSAGTAPRPGGVGVWNLNNNMNTTGAPGHAPFNMGDRSWY